MFGVEKTILGRKKISSLRSSRITGNIRSRVTEITVLSFEVTRLPWINKVFLIVQLTDRYGDRVCMDKQGSDFPIIRLKRNWRRKTIIDPSFFESLTLTRISTVFHPNLFDHLDTSSFIVTFSIAALRAMSLRVSTQNNASWISCSNRLGEILPELKYTHLQILLTSYFKQFEKRK